MDLAHPFAVITPTIDGDVLTVLAGADASFTPPQLHRLKPQHSEAGVRNSLRRLAGQGIVSAERVGNAYQYRLNRDHLAAGPILALAQLATTLRDRISAEVISWDPAPIYGAVFGSAARGDMTTDSDIDLFLVRPNEVAETTAVWGIQVMELERQVTAWTGNDTRVLEFDESEIRANAQSEPVLADIVAHGLTVAGDAAWLRELLRQRPARRGSIQKKAASGAH